MSDRTSASGAAPAAGTPPAPRLTVICSSASGQTRLDRIAAALLARMPRALAARLARTVLVFALDGVRHAAFAQGLGGPEDAVTALAAERVRQGGAADPGEPLHVIVLTLDHRHRQDLARLLGHELGHVALGHTGITRAAAAAWQAADDAAILALEREADAFANTYSDGRSGT